MYVKVVARPGTEAGQLPAGRGELGGSRGVRSADHRGVHDSGGSNGGFDFRTLFFSGRAFRDNATDMLRSEKSRACRRY